jgi:hypothetical protein
MKRTKYLKAFCENCEWNAQPFLSTEKLAKMHAQRRKHIVNYEIIFRGYFSFYAAKKKNKKPFNQLLIQDGDQ